MLYRLLFSNDKLKGLLCQDLLSQCIVGNSKVLSVKVCASVKNEVWRHFGQAWWIWILPKAVIRLAMFTSDSSRMFYDEFSFCDENPWSQVRFKSPLPKKVILHFFFFWHSTLHALLNGIPWINALNLGIMFT